MVNYQSSVVLPKVITQQVLLAVLNRCDDTREFMVEMWRNNPQLAKQGGSKVAMLLGQPIETIGWAHESSPQL